MDMFSDLAHKTCIVGLSGGPDSMYLLHQLVQHQERLSLRIYAAHFDHEWRHDSGQDVLFCKTVCDQLGVSFFSQKASHFSEIKKVKGSQEAYGRNLRRAFFAQLKQQLKADCIVLAHHQDDQVETFFIRLFRGASVQGLGGMHTYADDYVRPLLSLSKKEILKYLKKYNLSYVSDSTNTSDAYLRNRIRKYVVPALTQADERAIKKITDTMYQLQKAENFLQTVTDTYYKKIISNKVLLLQDFVLLDAYIQCRIIQKWLIEHKVICTLQTSLLNEVVRFLVHPRGGVHRLGKWSIYKKSNQAMILLD